MNNRLLILMLAACCSLQTLKVHAFIMSPPSFLCRIQQASSSAVSAGFGASSDKKKAAKKEPKLKPKAQWDRYGDLKKDTIFRVAVGVVKDDNTEWLEVGRVRSKDSKYTAIAVARQRALIAAVSCASANECLYIP